ncbi:MAG: hypothetical protein Q9160_005427 [Pyrenula sp. 1 TL-2023]
MVGSKSEDSSIRDNVPASKQTAAATASTESDPQNGQPTSGTPTAHASSTGQKVLLMLALCTVIFLAALDSTIVATAAPTIARSLNAPDTGYAWIGSSYLFAQATLIPVWGKISDVFGRKPILLIANAVFFLGSIFSGFAVNLAMFLAGRTLQGLGGGGMVLLVNISIMPCNAISMIALAFLFNIHKPKTPLSQGLQAVDWLGAILVLGSMLMILLGLDFGGVNFPWRSATVICLLVFGALTFCLFVFVQSLYEKRGFSRRPLLPIAALCSVSNVAALVVDFLHSLGAIAGLFYMPLYFQLVLGTDSLLSGIWLLPLSITYALSNVATGIWIRETGRYRIFVPLGMALLSLAYGLLIDLPSYKSWSRIIIFQLLLGISIGLNFQPPLLALQALTDPQDVGSVTSLYELLRFLGLAVSIVIGQVIFQSQVQQRTGSLRAHGVSPSLAVSLSRGDLVASIQQLNALGGAELAAVREVLATALSRIWIFYLCASFVGLVASFAVVGKTLTSSHQETVTGLKHYGVKKRSEAADGPDAQEKGSAEER